MKCLMLLSFSLLSTLCAQAQTNPVPDSSFEVWLGGTPQGWSTSGNVACSNDAHSGLFAARGTVSEPDSAPSLLAFFPIQDRPGMLEGYYKFTSIGGDELVIFAADLSNGVPACQTIFVDSSSTSEYRHFRVPFMISEENNPDSAMIVIEMENTAETLHSGSSFLVDDIAFSGTENDPFVSVHESVPFVESLSVYPNPFHVSTMLSFTLAESGYATVTLVNQLGVEVARVFAGELSAGEYSFPITVPAALPAGMYECVVRMNGGAREIPVVVSP